MKFVQTLYIFLPHQPRFINAVPTTLFFHSAAPQHSRVMEPASENSGKQRSENEDASKGSKLYSDHIMPHILNLYGNCAKAQDFEIYAPRATFEDPLMCAHGVKQIKSAFYSLKVFKESRIVEYTIDEKVTSPRKNQILIDSKQHYKFLGRDIDMISLIVLLLEDGKVVRHEDRWNKKPLLNRETKPVVGWLTEVARRASMLITHPLMGFGKDPSP